MRCKKTWGIEPSTIRQLNTGSTVFKPVYSTRRLTACKCVEIRQWAIGNRDDSAVFWTQRLQTSRRIFNSCKSDRLTRAKQILLQNFHGPLAWFSHQQDVIWIQLTCCNFAYDVSGWITCTHKTARTPVKDILEPGAPVCWQTSSCQIGIWFIILKKSRRLTVACSSSTACHTMTRRLFYQLTVRIWAENDRCWQ